MIAVEGLTKRFGDVLAVEDVSFDVNAGEVVGFLGHNGAGKTTTLRMLLGHVRPDAGTATFFGSRLSDIDRPLTRVGVLLDEGLHPGRTARAHLKVVAATGGLPGERIDELLELVGLGDAKGRRCGGFSSGMRRRLGVAAALLARPELVILDEPAAGLDPEGIRWLRGLLRHLADEGCGVLVSSHHLEDIGQMADRVVIMDRGRLVVESSVEEVRRRAGSGVAVRSPGAEILAAELTRAGVETAEVRDSELIAKDVPPRVVSELAASVDVPVWELSPKEPSLEDAFFELIEERRNAEGAEAGEDGDGPPPDGDGDANDDADPAPSPAGTGDEELATLERDLDARLDARPTLGAPRVVAVVATGRGLGRTSIAFLLADVLAAAARLRTLAVALSCDSDRMALPSPVEQRSALGLSDLLNDLPEFDEHSRMAPYVSRVPSGAETLSGVSSQSALEALRPAHVEALRRFSARFYDVTVLDVGEIPEAALDDVLTHADVVLVVGGPDDDAGESAESTVLDRIAELRGDRSLLVGNRAEPDRARTLLARELRDTVVIPRDRMLIRQIDAGDFRLAGAGPLPRVAVKRLALSVLERLT